MLINSLLESDEVVVDLTSRMKKQRYQLFNIAYHAVYIYGNMDLNTSSFNLISDTKQFF